MKAVRQPIILARLSNEAWISIRQIAGVQKYADGKFRIITASGHHVPCGLTKTSMGRFLRKCKVEGFI